VDVLPGQKGLLHGFVARDVGQDAQLDLAVVRVGQDAAGLCQEKLAQAAAQLGADGDVLQIGLAGRQPPGAGLGLVEGGVHAPVRPDDLEQALHVGAVELLVGAVLQDVLHRRAVGPQAFEGFGVGGVAALGLFAGRQAHFYKQGLAQLLGAVQVELVAHLCVNAGKALLQHGLELFAEGHEALPVHQHAGTLHIRQHQGQGELNVV